MNGLGFHVDKTSVQNSAGKLTSTTIARFTVHRHCQEAQSRQSHQLAAGCGPNSAMRFSLSRTPASTPHRRIESRLHPTVPAPVRSRPDSCVDHRQSADRVRKVERRRPGIASINLQSFARVCLAEPSSSVILRNIADVPQRVRQPKRLTERAINRRSFFVMYSRRVVISRVALDLSDSRNRLRKFAQISRTTRQLHSLSQIPARIVDAVFPPCLLRSLHQCVDRLDHARECSIVSESSNPAVKS